MSSVNKVILLGRLGQDPELTTLEGGKEVCKVSLATNETYKDSEGVKQENTHWHRVVLWGRLASVMAEYRKKGDQVYIEGKQVSRTYKSEAGDNREITEVIASNLQLI